MPTIVACFKWVIDEAYIRTGSSGDLDFSSVSHKLSDYDRNAIEEAGRLRDARGGAVIGVTVGAPEDAKGVKDALSRGPDRACFAADPSFRDLEPSQTSAILADVIRSRVEAYDLILCGEGSSDLYAQQVGPRLAELLGIPCIAFVQKLELEDGRLIAERRVEGGVEVVSSPLPAVVTVLPDINTPRIPGVKDTLTASRKPVTTISRGELSAQAEGRLRTLGLAAARIERTCELFEADGPGVAGFVEAVRRRGVIG